ncbi:MAG: hypothetical protein HY692_07025 [Cyanobacteria bacterium NC_groundwater_1444_Ag_S-0.65um_54_12]|nr:hypothetical protein [Cyanobacteria bacterium NC_groundwater_1444_Ag_S-0.65um_54_12]
MTSISQTPYQQLKNTKAGQYVRDNKFTTAIAGTVGVIATAGGAAKSNSFEKFAEKAIVPAAGAGAMALGGMLVHDALVNDLKDHKLRATGKALAGVVMIPGGAQAIGVAYDIPVMDQALTKPLKVIGNAIEGLLGKHKQMVGGGALALGGAGLAALTINDIRKNGFKEKHIVGLGASAFVPSGLAVMADAAKSAPSMQQLGPKAVKYGEKASQAIGGVALGALAFTRGKAALDNLNEGRLVKSAGNGLLSLAAGSGSAFLLADATGSDVVRKAANKIFEKAVAPVFEHALWPVAKSAYENPVAAAALTAGAVGVAAYAYFKEGRKE